MWTLKVFLWLELVEIWTSWITIIHKDWKLTLKSRFMPEFKCYFSVAGQGTRYQGEKPSSFLQL